MPTRLPVMPDVELRLVMEGPAVTVNDALAAEPPTVTTTFPDVAPAGTGTTMLVSFQLIGFADVPLNVTVLLPCNEPKPVPVIVTGVPMNPLLGFRDVIVGVTMTLTPALGAPFAVTTAAPVPD